MNHLRDNEDTSDSEEEDELDGDHNADPPLNDIDVDIDKIFSHTQYLEVFSESERSVLGPIPDSMKNNRNKFSTVLGDIFHLIDRPYVGTKNDFKKSWKSALSRAFLIFDATVLKTVTDALKSKRNMTDKQIEHMILHKTKWFCKRVPRVCPPASVLYYRVRAVFDAYGSKVDSSGRPLLNAAAVKKFKNVLEDIAAGYVSDPPGLSFYSPTYDKSGKMKTCSISGVPILHCSRGSNLTENVHNQLLKLIGHRNIGIEMADHLLREFRHRHNQNVAEVNRMNYPVFGHYDTWIIDLLQKLIYQNHNECRFYPHYHNTIYDRENTEEQFGIVPLHNNELVQRLRDRIDSLQLSEVKLSRDMKYVAKCEGVPIPFVPVHSKEEKELYVKLVCQQYKDSHAATIDFENFALLWCDHVDGINIFPKLPVYLRTYFTTFEHNSNVRASVRNAKPQVDRLNAVHRQTAGGLSPIIVSPRNGPIAITETQASNQTFLVGSMNMNPISNTSGFSSDKKKAGRPPGAVNRQDTAPRTCKNCQFHGDISGSKTCRGRAIAANCDKPFHASMAEHITNDQIRREKIKQQRADKKRKVDNADASLENEDAENVDVSLDV